MSLEFSETWSLHDVFTAHKYRGGPGMLSDEIGHTLLVRHLVTMPPPSKVNMPPRQPKTNKLVTAQTCGSKTQISDFESYTLEQYVTNRLQENSPGTTGMITRKKKKKKEVVR